jgi:hypothetical protein
MRKGKFMRVVFFYFIFVCARTLLASHSDSDVISSDPEFSKPDIVVNICDNQESDNQEGDNQEGEPKTIELTPVGISPPPPPKHQACIKKRAIKMLERMVTSRGTMALIGITAGYYAVSHFTWALNWHPDDAVSIVELAGGMATVIGDLVLGIGAPVAIYKYRQSLINTETTPEEKAREELLQEESDSDTGDPQEEVNEERPQEESHANSNP